MNRLSRLLDRLPDLVWVLVGICIWPLFVMFGPREVEEMEMTARETMKWDQLLKTRKDRMKKLIELNAPDLVIYNEARLLLIAETHNRRWAAIAKWAGAELKKVWHDLKFDVHQWWLMHWHGWPESCALSLACGEPESRHNKKGCNCHENFEAELLTALKREQV